MRNHDIQDNKYKILLPIREERKKKKPRTFKTSVKRMIQRIIQFRLIGYIVITIGLLQLDNDIEYVMIQMFLLILFTELQSRGVSKKRINTLKEELNIQQDIEYSDRDSIERKGLLAQEKKDSQLAKQDIEDNIRL